MRGCGAGGNISRARSLRSINRRTVRLLQSTCTTHAITARRFSFVGTQMAPVSTPPSHATVGGSLVVVKATASTSANMESPTFIMRPPHAPKSYQPRVSPHPLHQPATPNNDEHELHRRLRSQKASNRSFLRRHRNGRDGMSHFGNAPHMQHMHTTHTNTNTTAIGVAGGVLTVLYQSLDIPLKGGMGGISVDQRSNLFLFFEGASRNGCLWEGMGSEGGPELGTQSTGEFDLV